MPIIPFKDHKPVVSDSAFIAPDAWLTGKVEIGSNVSIFFGSVLRGDLQAIKVGDGSNIQEHSMLHTSHGMSDCIVGKNVTVGHRAILHGCEVEDNCIIGMGSVILDNAKIGNNCIIGAHSLISKGTVIPPNSLAFGSPAKVIRPLTEDEIESIKHSYQSYIKVGQEYKKQLNEK